MLNLILYQTSYNTAIDFHEFKQVCSSIVMLMRIHCNLGIVF